jgi:hypothetical protein
MRPLAGYVKPDLLISDLFKNSNSLAVVTEIIHWRWFGPRYDRFEPTVVLSKAFRSSCRIDRIALSVSY